MEPRNQGGSHVHFPDDQLSQHDSKIVIQSNVDGQLDVHLGFLQILHRYQIQFTIKDNLGEDITFDPLESLYVSLLEAVPTDDGEGHSIMIEFRALRDKLMKEKITFSDTKKTKSITLVFHARVLGKGKGTPALRDGIHCVGIEVDEDSEGSDWQGFN